MTHKVFIFESYNFDATTGVVEFCYSFDGERHFRETVQFTADVSYDELMLDRALQLAFIVAGISYYKTFFAPYVEVKAFKLTEHQAAFFNQVYYHGLSQYVYENTLNPNMIASFTGEGQSSATSYNGNGVLALQSGGKDSLLLAELLRQQEAAFTPWYVAQQGGQHPSILDDLSIPLRMVTRTIDREGLQRAVRDGGLNGHVPVTMIILSYALVDAVLHGENTILAAIGKEGEEPHATIGNYPVRHQWAKTWSAERLLANYVKREISYDIHIGSPLRGFSELKIAKMFSKVAWLRFGHEFSSCNVANYKQGHDNHTLSWCGRCPKCANSFLLFAPFIDLDELKTIFHGNLFELPDLTETFKGLLGVDDAFKPFECVGEIDELRQAYRMAVKKGVTSLSFAVPDASFSLDDISEHQAWAMQMLQ